MLFWEQGIGSVAATYDKGFVGDMAAPVRQSLMVAK